MKRFKGEITLNRNSRGCYILDTVKGCSIVNTRPGGCYGACYAHGIASRYGMDFGSVVVRDFVRIECQPSLFGFQDNDHVSEIVKAIRAAKMPFVRIGEMGDPSENWEHTLYVYQQIKIAGKPVVIITKHWKPIPDELLFMTTGLTINTSISAMDTDQERALRLGQYERLKPWCKSVLRIVSCDFVDERLTRVQDELFRNENTIDTVFRPGPKNQFLIDGVIRAKKVKFMRNEILASVRNEGQFLGLCQDCPDMCGINL